MRDLTAAETAERRRVESRLLDLFHRWGYVEVATPTLEYLDTLVRGTGPATGDRLLKLVDSGGEVLALRPEMTVPLARFAATRLLPTGPGPFRLSYVCSVFRRQERGSGKAREFTQAGVEMIGDDSVYADAEIIGLAGAALRAAGVDDPIIAVGHAGFLRGVLSGLSSATFEDVRDLLYRRAFADLESALPAGEARSALRMLPTLRGEGALARARVLARAPESRGAIDALEHVAALARRHTPDIQIEVDLAQIRDFDYYTGVIFEGHAPQSGVPLVGGGRYDTLLARFGHAAPATGFAVGVEYVIDALEALPDAASPTQIVFDTGEYLRAVEAARRLRNAGMVATVAPAGRALSEQARRVSVAGEQFLVEARDGGTTVSLDGLVDAIKQSIPETS
jgi:ATP phosphoribosyltransferase regulatory subunit